MNTAIILAAGQGTRMKSQTAKVLHKLGSKCLLQHVVDAASDHVETINVIVGHKIPAGTGNRKFNDIIVGYVDEYEELLAKKNLTFNEEI